MTAAPAPPSPKVTYASMWRICEREVARLEIWQRAGVELLPWQLDSLANFKRLMVLINYVADDPAILALLAKKTAKKTNAGEPKK